MSAALRHLEGLLVSLPEGHLDRPGVRRAIEVLTYMPGGGATGAPGEAQAPEGVERGAVPAGAPYAVRLEAVQDVLTSCGTARAMVVASPGSPGYAEGLTARCHGCGWHGTTQVASGLPTEEQRGLAEAQALRHRAAKILERLG